MQSNKRKFAEADASQVSSHSYEFSHHDMPLGSVQIEQETSQSLYTNPPIYCTPSQQTEEHIQNLKNQIRSVYGTNSTVYVTVLPTTEDTPRKRQCRTDCADLAPIPLTNLYSYPSQRDTVDGQDMYTNSTLNDSEVGYESSCYTSETVSPISSSPMSLQSKLNQSILEHFSGKIKNDDEVLQADHVTEESSAASPLSVDVKSSLRKRSIELDLTSCIEYTGVSEEDVQSYISEQSPDTNRWICLFPDCDKTFGRRENIKSHVQTHLGDRQYKCKNCAKRFVRQHDLKRHAKIHTGDKPYECPCGAGFARQDALTRHRQRGVCIGGFPNVIRRQARRGRPRKRHSEDESKYKTAKFVTKAAIIPRASSCASNAIKKAVRDYQIEPSKFSEDSQDILSALEVFEDKAIGPSSDFRCVQHLLLD